MDFCSGEGSYSVLEVDLVGDGNAGRDGSPFSVPRTKKRSPLQSLTRSSLQYLTFPHVNELSDAAGRGLSAIAIHNALRDGC